MVDGTGILPVTQSRTDKMPVPPKLWKSVTALTKRCNEPRQVTAKLFTRAGLSDVAARQRVMQ